MTRLKISALMFGLLILSSCSGDDKSADGGENEGKNGKTSGGDQTMGSGGTAGGTLRLAVNENVLAIFPYQVFDLSSAQVAEQVFESLVGFKGEQMEVVPELAESWSISEDGLEYTFKLRKDAKFHDDACFSDGKGRVVTAADVKFSMELLATKNKSGLNSNFEGSIKDLVKGATEFHQGKANEISGIEVVDEQTVKFVLNSPRITFLQRLGVLFTAVVPKEGYEKYGEKCTVGTGPFRMVSMNDEGTEIKLVRNSSYYLKDDAGVQLPYMDSVVFIKFESKVDELDAFQNGKLSAISGLPASKVSEVIQADIDEYNAQPPKRYLVRKQQVSTHYYEFNMTRSHFKDVRVRQAFNYAIDRKKIIEDVLSNQANAFGEYGITPPVTVFKGYDFDGIKEVSYSYNPEKARELMAQAGFPRGKGFPTLKLVLNSGGTQNSNVAREVVEQLERELGVMVNYDILSFEKKTEEANYGRADLVRTAWVADYPSPESFLLTLYGKNVPATLDEPSWPNSARYRNSEYDKILEQAIAAGTKEDSWKLFAEAEKIMMKDAPVIILWYTENYNMYLSAIRNLDFNPLQILDLKTVYNKPWTQEEWQASNNKK